MSSAEGTSCEIGVSADPFWWTFVDEEDSESGLVVLAGLLDGLRGGDGGAEACVAAADY